jgi:molybdenum cofactor cytidylyltransferase
MRPALVILAAGESRRLGACKALVDLGGRTVLARLLAAGACADGAPPLVVTGAHHVAIARAAPPGVEVLENPRWSAGRTGGLALAAAARPDLDLVIAPVDVPLVPAEVFALLVARWAKHGAPARGWLAPCVPGRSASGPGPRFGHPVLAGRGLLLELVRGGKDFPAPAAGAPPGSLRALRARAEPLLAAPTGCMRILDDLDTAADLEHLRALLS